jgi:hypothetical protein
MRVATTIAGLLATRSFDLPRAFRAPNCEAAMCLVCEKFTRSIARVCQASSRQHAGNQLVLREKREATSLPFRRPHNQHIPRRLRFLAVG